MNWVILYLICNGVIKQDVTVASFIDKTYFVETTFWVRCGKESALEYWTTYKVTASDTAFVKQREYKKALQRKKQL